MKIYSFLFILSIGGCASTEPYDPARFYKTMCAPYENCKKEIKNDPTEFKHAIKLLEDSKNEEPNFGLPYYINEDGTLKSLERSE